MKKRICILSFSPIYRDARVLRQIKYLSPYYNLTIVGYGQPHPNWVNLPNISWHSLGSFSSSGAPIISRDHSRSRRSLRQLFVEKYEGTLLLKFIRLVARIIVLPMFYIGMLSGRIWSSIYEYWYWKQPQHIKAFDFASQSQSDAIHANDWEALPVAAEVARINNAKVVFDAHEYAPLELENRFYWRLIYKPPAHAAPFQYSPKPAISVIPVPA